MATQQSLFERFGIKTPEQIRKEREEQYMDQMRSGNRVQSIAGSATQDIENLMRGFGWQSQAEKDAAKVTGLLSSIQAIPQENMTPEVEQYYTSQLAAISPELADQYQQDLTATRAAMLEASKGMYGTTKVAVPTYSLNKDTGETYQTGTRSIDVPAKFVQGKGWVPLDAQYQGAGNGSGDTPPIRGDLTAQIEEKLGIRKASTPVESDKRLPADAQRTSMQPVSDGIPAEMPAIPVAGDVTYGGSGSGFGRNENTGLVSYGGRNYPIAEFEQRFPLVFASMRAEGKL